MAGFGSKKLFEVKQLFFDNPKLLRTMNKVQLQNLSRAGAIVMTAARQSIRKTKGKVSSPGQPPRGHGRQLLRKNIFFGIDKSIEDPDCLVGPIKLNQVDYDKDGQPVRGTVPAVLEAGGEIWIKEVFRFGKWRRLDQRLGSRKIDGLPLRFRRVSIKARPFMGPALAANKKKFAGLWRGTFRKG